MYGGWNAWIKKFPCYHLYCMQYNKNSPDLPIEPNSIQVGTLI